MIEKLVTFAPVIFSITLSIKKDNNRRTSPPMANVKVFFAPSAFLGSPPEVMYLKPPEIRRKKRTIPANPKTRLTIRVKIPFKSEILAGSLIVLIYTKKEGIAISTKF